MKYDVIIIGGGAAGLAAAGFAADRGMTVLIVEKNARPGRKVLITGKGRCNLTNNCDVDTLISSVTENQRFLYSAFYGFNSNDTMELFEDRLKVPLKTERGNRVFPQSDRAADIVDALCRFALSGACFPDFLWRRRGNRAYNRKRPGQGCKNGTKGVFCRKRAYFNRRPLLSFDRIDR